MKRPDEASLAREAMAMTRRDVIQMAIEGRIKWIQAADILGVTPRHILRLRERYLNLGIAGLRDGRHGKPQPRRIPLEVEKEVCRLKRDVYPDFSVKHFHDKLVETHGLRISYTWTLIVLQKHGLVDKAPGRGKYHRKRERRPMRGMLVHLDASTHGWIPGLPMWDLVVAMDDADSRILYARFVEEEGTMSTLQALRHILLRWGRFCELYTDRGSHFCHTSKAGGPPDDEQFGQVSRVLKALGIRHILARSPQARGRSERAFGTIQGRLPQELRLAGMTSYEDANRYLQRVFVPDFNRRFTVIPREQESAFTSVEGFELDLLVSEHHGRKVRNDNTVRFRRLELQLPKTDWRAHFTRCPVTVHVFVDGTLGVSYQGRLLARYSNEGVPSDPPEHKRDTSRKAA